jgi:bifunctional non-homologous end joining protein LigD
MLATLVDGPFHKPGWVYEEKYDGIRAVAYRHGSAVRMYSRNLLDITDGFPDIADAIRSLDERELVLDGELVAFDAAGVSRFQHLQRRGLAGARRSAFAVFDCLHAAGTDLLGRPLRERRRTLEKVVPARRPLIRSRRLELDGLAAYSHAKSAGWEGIIAKDEGSIYEPGRRSRAWLKVKVRKQSEFVVAGYTPPEGSRAHLGALLVGLYDGDRLRYVGKVGTGYTASVLQDLVRKLEPLVTDAPAFDPAPRMRDATWVRPRLVAQVAYAEWTADGKLRQPAFLGLRSDKSPRECTWEERER